jgi:hypothetical protein
MVALQIAAQQDEGFHASWQTQEESRGNNEPEPEKTGSLMDGQEIAVFPDPDPIAPDSQHADDDHRDQEGRGFRHTIILHGVFSL